MASVRTIVFTCPDGAAKSVMAAAYFDQLASRRGLAARATAGGTDPDPAVPIPVVEALLRDGTDVRGHRPRRLTRAELDGAWRIVSLGCDPRERAPAGQAIEVWDDVPPPSRDLAAARDAIRSRVARLFAECLDQEVQR